MRAFGFCVSIEHARFMARHFNHATSPLSRCGVTVRRPNARWRCATLRPADPGGVLGRPLQRGCRRACCRHRADAPPDRQPRAPSCSSAGPRVAEGEGQGVLHGAGLRRHAPTGVSLRPSLPSADRRHRAVTSSALCIARFPSRRRAATWSSTPRRPEIVLRSLRDAIPDAVAGTRVESCGRSREVPRHGSGGSSSHESGLDLPDIYDGNTAGQICERPLVADRTAPGNTRRTPKALGRLLHIDDENGSPEFLRRLVDSSTPVTSVDALANVSDGCCRCRCRRRRPGANKRSTPPGWHRSPLGTPAVARRTRPAALGGSTHRVDHPSIAHWRSHPDCPSQVHARYTPHRDHGGVRHRRSGARSRRGKAVCTRPRPANSELFAFTLDKSSGAFSPTTRYRDYAMTASLIHWESQSTTRSDSDTGLRYRNHERDGRSVMLFSRLRADDRAFWFLGPATYRGHVGRSRWPSRGSYIHRYPATFISRSPPQSPDPAAELACGREPEQSTPSRSRRQIGLIHHGGKLTSRRATALVGRPRRHARRLATIDAAGSGHDALTLRRPLQLSRDVLQRR